MSKVIPDFKMNSNELAKCGFCNTAIRNQSRQKFYFRDCSVCKETKMIKDTCAAKLVSIGQDRKNQKQTVTEDEFNASTVELHCKHCTEKCFYCNKFHNGKFDYNICTVYFCKYNIPNMFNFCIGNNQRIVCNICKKRWCFILNEYKPKGKQRNKKKSACQEEDKSDPICSQCKQPKESPPDNSKSPVLPTDVSPELLKVLSQSKPTIPDDEKSTVSTKPKSTTPSTKNQKKNDDSDTTVSDIESDDRSKLPSKELIKGSSKDTTMSEKKPSSSKTSPTDSSPSSPEKKPGSSIVSHTDLDKKQQPSQTSPSESDKKQSPTKSSPTDLNKKQRPSEPSPSLSVKKSGQTKPPLAVLDKASNDPTESTTEKAKDSNIPTTIVTSKNQSLLEEDKDKKPAAVASLKSPDQKVDKTPTVTQSPVIGQRPSLPPPLGPKFQQQGAASAKSPSYYRYYNNNRDPLSFLPKIPQNKIKNVIDIIKRNFGIDQLETETKFQTNEEATVAFDKHFLALYGYNNNMMSFEFPKSCKEFEPEGFESPSYNLNFHRGAIKSLGEQQFVSDEAIDFVLKMFNFYNHHMASHNSVPEFIFGTPLDKESIHVTSGHHPELNAYINKKLNLNPDATRSLAVSETAKWYCDESKHHLSCILDHFQSKNQIVKKYVNVVNIGHYHWVMIVVELDMIDVKKNLVYSIDSLDNTDHETRSIRQWYSKYFGLYRKENSPSQKLSDNDMDCHEIMNDNTVFNPFVDEPEDTMPSFLEHKSRKPEVYQPDGYNCGIVCLANCLEMITRGNKMFLMCDLVLKAHLRKFRVQVLSMIFEVYMELNGNFYKSIQDQVLLDSDGKFEYKDQMKWLAIQRMFDLGKYKYDPANSSNANAIFNQDSSLEEVKKELEETEMDYIKNHSVDDLDSISKSYLSKSKKSSESDEEATYAVGGKKRKLSRLKRKSDKKRKKGEKDQKPAEVITDVKSLKIRTDKLQNMLHSRHNTIYDISDLNLLMNYKIQTEDERLDALFDDNIDSDKSKSSDDSSSSDDDDDDDDYEPEEKVKMEIQMGQLFDTDSDHSVNNSNDQDIDLPEEPVQDIVKSPNETMLMIRDLFIECYTKDDTEASRKSKEEFIEGLDELMRDMPVYFILDIVDGVYEVMAAVILEENIWLAEIDHALVHLTALRANLGATQAQKYLRTLMFHLSVLTSINTKDIYFVVQFGRHKFNYERPGESKMTSPMAIYKDMYADFADRWNDDINFALQQFVPNSSICLRGRGETVRRTCSYLILPNYKFRVCVIHNYIKVLARYQESSTSFDTFSHSYHWGPCKSEHVDDIPPPTAEICRKNPGVIYKMKGGGSREDSFKKTLKESDILGKIDEKFQQKNQIFANNCVWLSAALIVNQIKPKMADLMIDMLRESPKKYEWMFFTKIPHDWQKYSSANGIQTLNDNLQRKPIKFNLRKVRIDLKKEDGYYEYIFNKDRIGKYLCQLETYGGSTSHVVAIDCDNQHILDCHEPNILKLSKKNLDYCCGKYLIGVKRIPYCYQMKPQP